ncbi:MAG: hypothetical protein WDM91_12400 [Rhizomicrobium sp.]
MAGPAAAPGLMRRLAVAPRLAAWRHGRRVALPVAAFIASLVWPASLAIVLFGLFLPLYRIALLVLLPLSVARLARLGARLSAPDLFIAGFAVLQAVSLLIHHGLFAVVSSVDSLGVRSQTNVLLNCGTVMLETLGPYLLARAFIRTPADVSAAARLLILIVGVLAIVALVESVSGRQLFGGPSYLGTLSRFGFHRAAGPFPHPILWGVFAASIFALALSRDVVSSRLPVRVGAALVVLAGVATSISSSAFAVVAVQVLLLVWFISTRPLRHRLAIFIAGCVGIYVFIDVFSNRTPVQVLFDYAALNPSTGFYRTIIWQVGWNDFLGSPITGIGYDNWARPVWLGPTVDAFWLVMLLRYGLLAVAPFILGVATSLLRAVRDLPSPAQAKHLHLAYFWLASVISLIIAGFTVHFWLQSYVEFFFLLGMWGAFAAPQTVRRMAQPVRR